MHQLFDSVSNNLRDAMPVLAATIAAVVGGVGGGFLVHWLTRSRDQEAPVRDPDKDELRELLSALTKITMYEAER